MLHAILLLQLVGAPLSPQAEAAEELVHASIREYDAGQYEKALTDAEGAYRLYPLAEILFNIGQCQRALKHWDKVAFFFERYLQKLPDAPNREKVEAMLAEAQYRIQAAAARPAPPPPAVVVVAPSPPPFVAPPPPVARAPEPAPPAAVEPFVETKPEEPARSHTSAWVLGSVAVASLAFMVVGIVEVENFEAVAGRLNSPTSYTGWTADEQTATSGLAGAQAWEVVAFTTGALALGTGTAAVLTW